MHNSLAAWGIHAPLQLMAPSFLTQQSDYLQILFLSLRLDVRSLTTLDVFFSIGPEGLLLFFGNLMLSDNFGRLQLIMAHLNRLQLSS